MSPRRGFDATVAKPDCESPRLTIIVPAIQRRTLKSFNQVNLSPKNARDTRKVKRLDALLKIVFDCISHKKKEVIKMHDGIVRTLTEVRHVLKLKKNLVSMGLWIQKVFVVGLKVELCKLEGKGSM